MNRFVAALAACLVLFAPSIVLAQSAVQPYLQPPTGPATTAKADASGNAKVAEQFPLPYQVYQEVLYNSTVAAGSSSSENLSAAIWTTAHLYPIKAVRIRAGNHTIGAQGTGIGGPLIIRVRGSWDGVNFAHIRPGNAAQDTMMADTLQFKVWENPSASGTMSPNGRWFNLTFTNGAPLPFPYLQFAIVNRGSATDSVVIEVSGRQQ